MEAITVFFKFSKGVVNKLKYFTATNGEYYSPTK